MDSKNGKEGLKSDPEITNLEQLLDRIESAAEGGEQVSIKEILESVGSRSFGPMILLAGLVILAPLIGDIPGVPTIMALFVLLTAGQLLFRQNHFWLPSWMTKRSVEQDKLRQSMKWLRYIGRFFDKISKPRLTELTQESKLYAIAVACILVALAIPIMEVVPFSANIAGIALTAFGLSLITRDGLMALVAFTFTVLAFVVVIVNVA